MKMLKMAAVVGWSLVMVGCPNLGWALDNATFTKVFSEYDEALEKYVTKLVGGDWPGAAVEAEGVVNKSREMKELAEKDSNPNWLYDVTNLFHHSQELVEATKGKEAVEGVFLVGILEAHIGYIQSANPEWLKVEVGRNIEIIEQGIAKKDQKSVRDAAEVVHSSSNKIVLSSGTMKHVYNNTRWLNDVRQMNGLGDAIIGEVNSGDWEGPARKIVKIKEAYDAWAKSFK